LKTGLWVRPGH